MKKKTKKKVKKTSKGTQVVGYVMVEFVQPHVPESEAVDVAGALSQLVSMVYRQQTESDVY